MDYLGHIVSSVGVSLDPAKVLAISNWSEPQLVYDV